MKISKWGVIGAIFTLVVSALTQFWRSVWLYQIPNWLDENLKFLWVSTGVSNGFYLAPILGTILITLIVGYGLGIIAEKVFKK